MNVHPRPIGVFDSGLGGLSVLRELRALLPAEDVLDYADSAHCPYGALSSAAILGRSRAISAALLGRGAKLLVVACNTASAVALAQLRVELPDVPIVGLVPAVKPAVATTRTGRIAVLATPQTVASAALASLIRDHAGRAEVILVPALGLVELVEAGETAGLRAEAMLRRLLVALTVQGVDTLVLGCTHYPFLSAAIRRLVGRELTVVDSGEAIARRVRAVLDEHSLEELDGRPGTLTLLTSGDPAEVGARASRLLGTAVTATRSAIGRDAAVPTGADPNRLMPAAACAQPSRGRRKMTAEPTAEIGHNARPPTAHGGSDSREAPLAPRSRSFAVLRSLPNGGTQP